MTTATSLGLGGAPASLLGAYITNLSCSLGLSQSPSTCSVTLAEDLNSTPQVLFTDPDLGSYVDFSVGPSFSFQGIVVKYTRDIANISGRLIKVDIADPREIMTSIPIILAPGYDGVVAGVAGTECSVIDAFGAFNQDGFNFAEWNQSGMKYENIILAFTGGLRNIYGVDVTVNAQVAKAFGESYLFDLSEITPLIDPLHRINTNLISMADFVQELATSSSFDWFTECTQRPDGVIVVSIKTIDRSTDNTDIDLDTFLANNSGFIISASRGFELRNDVACSVILGAQVESMKRLSVNGLANNPIDLSDEGGSSRYYMAEEEMRVVLANKEAWKGWVYRNGGLNRYNIFDMDVTPLYIIDITEDRNQLGKRPVKKPLDNPDADKRQGQIYEKLKGHAEATYGKRFLFSGVGNVDYIDAVWTLDAVAGNDDANEYFRNNDGKTRCYVEFITSTNIAVQPANPTSTIIGKGQDAAQSLSTELANSFAANNFLIEADKANYIRRENSLFVSATIEEGGIVKLDAPVLEGQFLSNEVNNLFIQSLVGAIVDTDADNNLISRAKHAERRRKQLYGVHNAPSNIHGKCYEPKVVYVPTREKILRYGPVFSSSVSPTAQGRLEIIQDDGFSPWEFGSTQLMIDSMQFKVDNQASNVKTVETANISIEGFPRHSIGASLGLNSNINSINISFGGQVNTSYSLTSFTRQFGELTKQELASLSLFARRGGARAFPQDTVGFMERYRSRVSRQFSGRGSSSSSGNSGGAVSFE